MGRSPAVQAGAILPQPPAKYDIADQREVRRLIAEAMRRLLDWGAIVAVPGNIEALGKLDSAADTVPYFTGPEEMAITALTAFGRSLLAANDAAGGRTVLGMGTLAQRFNVTLATASLADVATENGVTSMSMPTAALLQVSANHACRVRLYGTNAARTLDAGRDINTKPTAGEGLLAEFVFDTPGQVIPLSPIALLANGDNTETDNIYYAVQNLSGSATAITLTLLLLHLELPA